MYINPQSLLLTVIALFHVVKTWQERKTILPPGKLIEINGRQVHLEVRGEGQITVIVDHSLGGIEGYFLVEEIAKLTQICIYDRPGYGWSQFSPRPRHSINIVRELDLLLTKANIKPPYILLGNSFGSYNMRLYAHTFPEKVKGLILTDGLHEAEMLNMSWKIKLVKYLFISGFAISIVGASLGIIRALSTLGLFEAIKPELRQFNHQQRRIVKRSFYHYSHWLTMARELINLDRSSQQLQAASNLESLPLISIKSQTFFQPSLFTKLLPIAAIDRLRNRIHLRLSSISCNYTEIIAFKSSHFVWIDEPEIIIRSVQQLLSVSEN